MANKPTQIRPDLAESIARIERRQKEIKEMTLKSGGGGGTSDGMEARVAVLEAHVEHIRGELAKLAGVPTDVATLKERVSHLPGKGFVVTAAMGTVGGLTAILILLGQLGLLSR